MKYTYRGHETELSPCDCDTCRMRFRVNIDWKILKESGEVDFIQGAMFPDVIPEKIIKPLLF